MWLCGHGGGIFKQVVLLSIYVQSGPDSYNKRSEREVLDGMLWIREGTQTVLVVHMNQKMIM